MRTDVPEESIRIAASPSQQEMEACLRVLQQIADRPTAVPQSDRFKGLISKIYKESKRDDQRADRWRRQQEDRAVRNATGMVQIQRDAVPAAALITADTDASRTLNIAECCYICKAQYTEVHFFYHLLCP